MKTLFAALAVLMVACTGPTPVTVVGPAGPQGPQGPAGGTTGIAVFTTPADSTTCPNGGTEVLIYSDVNGNGQVDLNDHLLSSFSVCNGAPGTSCSATTLPPSPSVPNGGAEITCGTTTAVILNGAPGVPGPAGDAGVTGTPGTVVTTVALPNGDPNCQYGGVEILLDGTPAAYVCNGAPGPQGPPGPPTLDCAAGYQLNTKTNTCGKVCNNDPKSLTQCPGQWVSPNNSCSWPQNGANAVCLP